MHGSAGSHTLSIRCRIWANTKAFTIAWDIAARACRSRRISASASGSKCSASRRGAPLSTGCRSRRGRTITGTHGFSRHRCSRIACSMRSDFERRAFMLRKSMNRGGYADLPERFFARVDPMPVAKPQLLRFNHALGAELGLGYGGLDAEALAGLFSGNVMPQGAEPIAMAYAGHQFGHFVPQLGDGRAVLLGEVLDGAGVRRDIQLKGSGRTRFSRDGDGRAALGPVLREYLVSEAMHALGIPSTRALAAVATGETVFREGPLPGAILTRVAASFVRVGTFQYFAARNDVDAVRQLADYVIQRHYPEAGMDGQPYLALLRAVTEAQASLIAQWMLVGFIHGVMNTDNMAVSGETIDFGPCAFVDSFDPAAVFSSIDSQGRYAFGNQPPPPVWNLARFAETLLPIIDPDPERAVELATAVIGSFSEKFADAWLAGLGGKLGLSMREDGDAALADD